MGLVSNELSELFSSIGRKEISMTSMSELTLKCIGVVESHLKNVEDLKDPSNWSRLESRIIIRPEYQKELEGIEDFLYIAVLHWMPGLSRKQKKRLPPELKKRGARDKGAFAKRTPMRPNPIGISIVELAERGGNVLIVKGLDAIDGTPILDIRVVSRCGPLVMGAGPMQNWTPYKRHIFKERLRQTIIEKGVKRGDLVLDAGAGSGFLSFPIAEKGGVLALDRSASILKKLETLIRERAVKNIFPVIGDVGFIPLKSGCVDVVISSFLLSLIPMRRTMEEFVRVLKPGGKMVLADFSLEGKQLSEHFAVSEEYRSMLHSQNELREVMESCGVSEVVVSKWEDSIVIVEGVR